MSDNLILNKDEKSMCISCYAAMESGKPLEPFSYKAKALGPKDIKIAITHCGVCHSDVHLIDNDWGISQYPLVPGHEIVGTVAAVGSEVTTLSIGQRVGVGGQAGACHECENCAKGQDKFCATPVYTAVHDYGGFATEIHVDSSFAFPIPDSISSEVAAPLLCAGITTFTPLNRDVKATSKVGVIGVGGLGHVALQYAKAFGCEVTAFSTSPGKEKDAKAFGANHFINTKDPGQMEAAAGTLDYILSTVSADLDWGGYLNALKPAGTICVLGVGESIVIPNVPFIFGEKTITSSLIGNRSDFTEMLEFSARHNIAPKVEVIPMSKAAQAIDTVRTSRLGHRIVLAQ
jgi:uncharacterized zinc-type alcohol dehydrogenase-like protein